MRVLTDPAQTGAAVLSLPQDVQSHAYDWPAELFDERDWVIRRPVPDPDEIDAVVRMLRAAVRPLIIAGGGVIYSGATRELEALAAAADPGGRDVRRQGRGAASLVAARRDRSGGDAGDQRPGERGGSGPDGRVAAHRLRHGVASLFQNPDVRFASINVDVDDAGRLGATRVVADAKRALAALTRAVQDARITSPAAWERRVRERNDQWQAERAAALDPDTPFDKSTVATDSDVVTSTDAVLTQGQIIGLLQEQARHGDTIIAAAGGHPETCRRSGTPPTAATATWSSASPAWATRSQPDWACDWRSPTEPSAWCRLSGTARS